MFNCRCIKESCKLNCMKFRLCCIFNYAPLYRKSIYLKIDQEFDAQFYFGDMISDIAKMDYNDFKKSPKTIRDRSIFRKLLWRMDILSLPFKDYDNYLIIGDSNISYLFFIPLCHLLGKKVYAWGHGCKTFKGKLGLFNKWFYKHCDCFLTYGENARKRLIDLGVSPDKLEVIYNSLNPGVDKCKQRAYKSSVVRDHFQNDYPVLLFVGRLTKVKQLDWIINALEYHKSAGLHYNVLLIGDGEDKGRLTDLLVTKELKDRVWFYGECYNDEELSLLLYNVDLCVSPGNVGLTALHAMSYGTPVLSHDDFESQMPEYETIVPGKTGELYRKGNFEDFCSKIESWLAIKEDRSIIRDNCYAIINGKWNSNHQIDVIKKILVK